MKREPFKKLREGSLYLFAHVLTWKPCRKQSSLPWPWRSSPRPLPCESPRIWPRHQSSPSRDRRRACPGSRTCGQDGDGWCGMHRGPPRASGKRMAPGHPPGLDALERSRPTGDLVWEHPTDNTHDHVGRGLVVERTLDGVGVHALGALHEELHLVTHEGTGDDDILASGQDNLLAEECLLSDEGGQATKEVVTGIDHNELLERHCLP